MRTRGRSGKKNPLNKESFTIIELLVSITIITVVVALMLPAVMEARLRAQKVICEVQRNAITRYDDGVRLRLEIPTPVLTKCYECHVPNRYRQPSI
jgi:type II secretory pathway pseudopilin PulG